MAVNNIDTGEAETQQVQAAEDQRETVIRLTNVSKTFRIREDSKTLRDRVFNMFSPKQVRQIRALRDINLEIKKGEFFGVIGHNGSGKSTLLRVMAGTYPPDKGGEVEMKGRFMRLSLGMGFDPELTAHENIFLNASILGLTMKQIRERHDAIIAMAELDEFVDTQVKFFSTGMRSRLMFAIAVQAEADIFLMDEFFGGVGDLRFKSISEKIFQEAIVAGRTIVHVSHGLETIRQHCDRVMLLEHGQMVCIGEPNEVIDEYHRRMHVAQHMVPGHAPH
ncbi:MAG: ABC transporter ATP-binding protein [Saprospiraceae bacterium]|nr:ABC transporter ATP-binding protein [Saprospiraceae bacterium]